eukprot:3080721-Alexandrium_andersonii.AAC.1
MCIRDRLNAARPPPSGTPFQLWTPYPPPTREPPSRAEEAPLSRSEALSPSSSEELDPCRIEEAPNTGD